MLIIYAIKTDEIYDLHIYEDGNLVWFGCIGISPASNLDLVYDLIAEVEEDYSQRTIKVFEYERKRY